MVRSFRQLMHLSLLLLIVATTDARIGRTSRRTELNLLICASDCHAAIEIFETSDPCYEYDSKELEHGGPNCYIDCDDNCVINGGECLDPVACYTDDKVAKMAEGVGYVDDRGAFDDDKFDDDYDDQYDDEYDDENDAEVF
mmetsp:Transcript_28646/g.34894  ORF Transcript_28646/g.34894 Transcript_28646/m.34894 type:complete len:141 (+) Transcript_28646:85-507(+)